MIEYENIRFASGRQTNSHYSYPTGVEKTTRLCAVELGGSQRSRCR